MTKVLLFLAAWWLALPVHADMWVYVDAQGVKHFASQKLDSRYKRLFQGTPQPETAVVTAGLSAARLGSLGTAPRITNLELSPRYMAVKPYVRAAADANQIDMALLQAVIATESGFDASAVSPKGAIGLMQVMPATAARYGVTNDQSGTVAAKLTDPRTNIHTGARYLRDLIQMFPGQLELAVAAYNAGEGAVARYRGVPPYAETRDYVRRITASLGYRYRHPFDAAAAEPSPALALIRGPGRWQ